VTTGWRKPNPKWAFSPEQDEVIRDAYRRLYKFSQRSALTRLSHTFGYPKHAIIRRGRELGIARAKEKKWSDTELQMLQDLARYTPAVISRKMSEAGYLRSETAIGLKRKRLKLKGSIENGWTATQLSVALGVDNHKVARWIKSGLLHAERLGTRLCGQNGDIRWIERADILTFLFDHPEQYDLAKVEKYWLLDLFRCRVSISAEEDSLP
jgi:hypothetical protein